MTIIYFSDSYKGGNTTFLQQNILFNLKNKKKVILFDQNPKHTFPNLKKHKYLKVFKLNIFKDRAKIKKLIKRLNLTDQLFFFTNFAILIYYFLFFISFNPKKKAVLSLALHSGIFQYSFKTIIGVCLFSILSLRLNYLIFGSNSSKKWWLKLFPWMKLIKHKVIFNGVEKRKIKKNKSKKIQISFIGRLAIENDPELFINISKLNEENKNMKFNIFGDGPLKKKLLKNNDNIKFWGWSKQSRIYLKTDITIITSPINNFPYTALESNSYGIPVISAARGDIRKIIKNNYNGYIFNKRIPLIFNHYIHKTIKNYKYLSKNSLINAKKFNINKSCFTFWKFLKIENSNTK